MRNSPAIRESTPYARWPLAPPARGPSASSIAAGAPQFPKSAAAPHLVVGAACRCRATTSTDTERERTPEYKPLCATARRSGNRPPYARWPLAPPARGPSASSIAAGAPQFPKSAAAPHLVVGAACRCRATTSTDTERERTPEYKPLCATARRSGNRPRSSVAPRPASPRSIRQLHRRRRTAIPKIGGSSTPLLSAPRAAAAPPRQRIRRERGRLSTNRCAQQPGDQGIDPVRSVAPRPASPRSIRQLHRRRRTQFPKSAAAPHLVVGAACRCRATTSTDTERERTPEYKPLCATARRSGNRPRTLGGPSPRQPEVHPPAPSPPAHAIPKIGGSSTPWLSAPRAAAAPPRQRIRRERGRLSTNRCAQQPGDQGIDPVRSVAPRPASPRSIRQLHRRRRTAIPKIGGSSTPWLSAPRAAAAPPRQRIRRERGRLSYKPLCATARRSGNRPRTSVAPRPASPRSIRQLHRRRRTQFPKSAAAPHLGCRRRVPLPRHHVNGYGEREDA